MKKNKYFSQTQQKYNPHFKNKNKEGGKDKDNPQNNATSASTSISNSNAKLFQLFMNPSIGQKNLSQNSKKQSIQKYKQQSKRFPSLNRLEKQSDQPINFKYYETFKKNYKLKRKKLYQYQPISLFLEGSGKQDLNGQNYKKRSSNNLYNQSNLNHFNHSKSKQNLKNFIIKELNKRQHLKKNMIKNSKNSQISQFSTVQFQQVNSSIIKNNKLSDSFLNLNLNLSGNYLQKSDYDSENIQAFQFFLIQKQKSYNNKLQKNKFNINQNDSKQQKPSKQSKQFSQIIKIQHKYETHDNTDNADNADNADNFNFGAQQKQQQHKNVSKDKNIKQNLLSQNQKNQKNNNNNKNNSSNNNNNNEDSNKSKIHNNHTAPKFQPSQKKNQTHSQKKLNIPIYLTQKQLSKIKCESFIVVKFTQIKTQNCDNLNNLNYSVNEKSNQDRISRKKYFQQYKVFTSNYSKKVAEIASLTKIMTFFSIIQISKLYKIKLNEISVKIDEEAQSMTGTSAQILSGDIFTIQELLYGLMLPSGNDAAIALAKWGGLTLIQNCHHLASNSKIIQSNFSNVLQTKLKSNNDLKVNNSKQDQSIQRAQKSSQILLKIFVCYMNHIAKNIGLKSSVFANPHGLPNCYNVSNVQDLALLLSKCIKDEIFLKVIGTKSYSIWVTNQNQKQRLKHPKKREIIWENTHKLLRRQNFLGGKTGVTVTAGPCLATIYKSPITQQIFIVVLLRAPKLSRRFKQTRLILGWTLQKIDSQKEARNQAKKYQKQVTSILKQDKVLDSDNSSDEQQFDFKRNDSEQMDKRNKILIYEM